MNFNKLLGKKTVRETKELNEVLLRCNWEDVICDLIIRATINWKCQHPKII